MEENGGVQGAKSKQGRGRHHAGGAGGTDREETRIFCADPHHHDQWHVWEARINLRALIKTTTKKRNVFEKTVGYKHRQNKYFAPLHNDPKPAEHTRNVCVIAHPDHGKTTLADALLLKAGLLHRDKAGDQKTGRSLDTLQDEKERGITIKSAPITLHFSVKKALLHTSLDEVSVYVGNLPSGFLKDDLESLLTNTGVGSFTVERCNAKRGFAFVRVYTNKTLRSLLALNGAASLHGRPLVVQPCGGDPLTELKKACDNAGLFMPTLSTPEMDSTYTGVATWPAMGGVIVQAPETYDTKKAARQAVAQECLHFLFKQNSDHNTVLAEKEASKETQQDHVDEKVPLTVNLIDCPGHVEFAAEVAAALRVSDGALLVVDALEGMAVQTEQVLIQALREGVKPVLMVNKVDRLILDLKLTPREIYSRIQLVVDKVNAFMASHQAGGEYKVSFVDGNVCFGSGYFGWSCSLDSFASKLMDETAVHDYDTICRNLAKPNNFVDHIMKPIVRMHRACGILPCLKESKEKIDKVIRATKLLEEYGISCKRLLKKDEDPSVIEPRKLLKKAMMLWLPAADAIVDMVTGHIPSPIQAQRTRAPILYPDISDPCGQGILHCDPAAPVTVFVSKMTPNPRGKNLLAFGRVFSGTIRPGDTIMALRADGKTCEAKITRLYTFGVGERLESIASASAGQIVALDGIDSALNKAGTLTTSLDGKPINHMVMNVSPILQYSVKPKDPMLLTKMVTALQQIVKADGTALFFKDEETGQYILAGAGTLHIEVLVSTLTRSSGVAVELSEPIIAYRETVGSASGTVLGKTDNKHNRIFIRASPLPYKVLESMSSGEFVGLDAKTFGKELVKKFAWDPAEATRVLAVGPAPSRCSDSLSDVDQPTCLLVDSTYGLQIPQDARENIIEAFHQVTQQGILVQSPLRGVRFDLVDAKFHQDSVHRRPIQVVPAASRAMKGAFLSSAPHLFEPVYRADIRGATGFLNGAYSVLGQIGAAITDTSSSDTTESIVASLPVRCAFGLGDALSLATKGRALVSYSYDGMGRVPEGELAKLIADTRARKGLAGKIPVADDFVDRL